MSTRPQPLVPLGGEPLDAAPQRTPWRSYASLSSMATMAEDFLARSGFDRGPWLAVALAFGIIAWFWLDNPAQWSGAIAASLGTALVAGWRWRGRVERTHLMWAVSSVAVLVAIGIALIWARSEMVGAPAFERPVVIQMQARVIDRIEQPAEERVRLILAARHPDTGEAVKLRVNLPLEADREGISEGAVVAMQARLMPPAPPMLPGAYNFARAAWFQGFAATGSVQGEVTILEPAGADSEGLLSRWQRQLSAHVRAQLGGSAGTIAAAFASGDRGAIDAADDEAMRDAGLTHLLSISGLHVSALMGGAYFLALKLLALWPGLALRVRLPIAAAGIGALAGIGYTLLTGAEVPTVRSCLAALLVLIALVLGRQALSLRMVAVASMLVMLLWPESVVGPSFQMSFSAVIAIIALHNAAPIRAFLQLREEPWLRWFGRRAVMLLVTGFVIEIALMPIVLFHFHRAGFYGAIANLVAIPLVTFASMPLIALALALDLVGLGAPAWWLVGKSLDLMLWIAHFTAGQPGAVKLVPQMGYGTLALFVAGGLWLALWQGRARLLGLVPAIVATLLLVATPVPDILISGDGRHVGITGEDQRLLVLRESRSSFTRDNLSELAGFDGEPLPLEHYPGARCTPEFCVMTLKRGGREWSVLMSRNRELVTERALAAACERADIVVSDRWLPRSCKPRWLKADRRTLAQSGGLAIVLEDQHVTTVAEAQGHHGWWRGHAEE